MLVKCLGKLLRLLEPKVVVFVTVLLKPKVVVWVTLATVVLRKRRMKCVIQALGKLMRRLAKVVVFVRVLLKPKVVVWVTLATVVLRKRRMKCMKNQRLGKLMRLLDPKVVVWVRPILQP
jgi:hypothetical protein